MTSHWPMSTCDLFMSYTFCTSMIHLLIFCRLQPVAGTIFGSRIFNRHKLTCMPKITAFSCWHKRARALRTQQGKKTMSMVALGGNNDSTGVWVCFSASFLSYNHMRCALLPSCCITALPLPLANERRVLPPPLAAPLPTSLHWNGPMALCPTCVACLQAAAGAYHLFDDKGPVLPLTQHRLSSYFVEMAHCPRSIAHLEQVYHLFQVDD